LVTNSLGSIYAIIISHLFNIDFFNYTIKN
jgi:hypothetical protein